MSNPYGHRGRCPEPPSPSDYRGNDGSNPAQASGHDQDASIRQYHWHEDQDPNQQPTEQLTEYPSIYADEYYRDSDSDAYHYSLRDPYSDSDEDSYGCSQSDPYSDIDADSVRHPDEQYNNPDEKTTSYPQRNPHDDGDMEEDSGDHPVDEAMADTFQRTPENSRLRPHQVLDARQAQGSYPAAGTAPAAENFQSPGFTSWEARPSRSQPYAPSRTAGTWARDRGLQPLPDLVPNPFRSVERPVTGFEGPATGHESNYSPQEEWDVRIGVAKGAHLEEILDNVHRTAKSVQNFIASNGLMWTPKQDEQLIKSMNKRHDMGIAQELLSRLGGPMRSDDEVQARVKYLERSAGPAQRAELATTHQPNPQQYPAVCQAGEGMSPQARHGAAADTVANLGQPPWTREEIEILTAWVAHNGGNWVGAEDVLIGRTREAIRAKWKHLPKAFRGNALREYEQGDSVARWSTGASQRKSRAGNLSEDDISFLKCQFAKNISLSELISQGYFSGYSAPGIMNGLWKRGWSAWTNEEDREVRELQEQEGDEWAQISSKPNGKSRTRDEVIIRHLFLRDQGDKKRKKPYTRHFWTLADDKKLGLEAARGMSWVNMSRQVFTHVKPDDIGKHARMRGVRWTREDDLKLWDMNLEPWATLDWDSIGEQWDPARDGDHVKERWRFLHRRSRGKAN